jgi:hypothetical protein
VQTHVIAEIVEKKFSEYDKMNSEMEQMKAEINQINAHLGLGEKAEK